MQSFSIFVATFLLCAFFVALATAQSPGGKWEVRCGIEWATLASELDELGEARAREAKVLVWEDTLCLAHR